MLPNSSQKAFSFGKKKAFKFQSMSHLSLQCLVGMQKHQKNNIYSDQHDTGVVNTNSFTFKGRT